MRRVTLGAAHTQELEGLRDHASQPYLRERAAGILKVAAGKSAAAVARGGLLRRRYPDTVCTWLDRYLTEGPAGLRIGPGRGRKPAFFPLQRSGGQRRPGPRRPA